MMGVKPASVSPCVHAFTLSDMNISETSWPIIIKFHLKHHWGGGLAALGFGPDCMITLVSWQQIAPIGLLLGQSCEHSSSSIFHWIFFIVAGNNNSNKSLDGFKLRLFGPGSAELATLERLKKSP